MSNMPLSKEIVNNVLTQLDIADASKATIRQMARIAETLETECGEPFIHLEIGSPGLPAEAIGVAAQKHALDAGVANKYPNIMGIQPLKESASRFAKAFLDVDVDPEGCISTVGSMMGTFASFMMCCRLDPKKDTVLFINPGFSVQPLQVKILRYKVRDLDVYDKRGEKLRNNVEEILKEGNIAAIIYSNPNNPSWVCLTENELSYIGALATKYDAIVIEDLAYLGMDFRKDMGHPYQAPFQPTVAKYTDNYMLMLSSSKIFSYAGERQAVVAISDKLFHRHYDSLADEFGIGEFGNAFVYVLLYALSSGVSHSGQYALSAMYDAACEGSLNFVAETSEYARRTKIMKEIFTRNGFHIVYDKDLDREVSDGFFFTIGRKGYTGDALVNELLRYGISAISLSTTGSRQQGIRACSSVMTDEQYPILDARLALFNLNNS